MDKVRCHRAAMAYSGGSQPHCRRDRAPHAGPDGLSPQRTGLRGGHAADRMAPPARPNASARSTEQGPVTILETDRAARQLVDNQQYPLGGMLFLLSRNALVYREAR